MNTIFTIIIILAFLYGLLMLWYRYGWRHLRSFSSPEMPVSGKTRVSVVIPARNEERHVLSCLEAVSLQSYPEDLLEIIVVNDHSTDRTAELVENFTSKNVRLVNLSEYLTDARPINSYKKKAIETAIELCTGDLIITTDADCVMNQHWVTTLVSYYENNGFKFMAAPVSFHRETCFFKVFQSLDFLSMQGITGATAHLRCGTMCNGANLAYEKKAFQDVGAFQGIDCIASGDDMLLMYKMYKAYPDGIGFVKHPHAIVHTLPAENLIAFMHQRIRWASKADKYEDKRLTMVLAFVYLWNIVIFALFVAGFFYPLLWLWCICLIIFKTSVELFFLWPVARFFQKTRLLWQFFPAQFLHIPYIIVAGWLGKFGSYQWKDRRVR
jgi:cellulose synthase/poly-beta-1,6-N-acetylglucosamine synthase-like glycosyltransferase